MTREDGNSDCGCRGSSVRKTQLMNTRHTSVLRLAAPSMNPPYKISVAPSRIDLTLFNHSIAGGFLPQSTFFQSRHPSPVHGIDCPGYQKTFLLSLHLPPPL